MSEHAQTRRELEASLRSLLPGQTQIGKSLSSGKPASAVAGLTGAVSGYVWGWIRGRRSRKKR